MINLRGLEVDSGLGICSLFDSGMVEANARSTLRGTLLLTTATHWLIKSKLKELKELDLKFF